MLKIFSVPKHMIALIIVVLASAIGIAWFLEFVMKLEPCSLCLLQRWGIYFSFIGLIPTWFILSYMKKKCIKIGALVIFSLISFTGLAFSLASALRQTYIQLAPAGLIPDCGADLQTLLSIVTPLQAISRVFQGSGECSEKALVVLGLSLAMWVAVLMSIIMICWLISLVQIIRKK
jgi:protein dithiol:quinone oxidoreductase